MRASRACWVQNLLHDIQAAIEAKGTLAASDVAQRRLFLKALRDDVQRRQQLIYRANLRDCDAYSERSPHKSLYISQSAPSSTSASSSTPTATPALSRAPLYQQDVTVSPAPAVGASPSFSSATSTASAAAPARTENSATAAPKTGSSPPPPSSTPAGVSSPRQLHFVSRPSHSQVPPSVFTSGGTGLHHRQFSQIKLDKLCAMIDHLLTVPDPLALPEDCWLGRLAGAEACHVPNPFSTTQGGASAEPSRSRDRPCPSLADPAIEVCRIPVPIGLVGVLSRYRPRMCIDAVAMGILAGNALVLDAGSTLHCTNLELMESVHSALSVAGLPSSSVVYVETYGGRSEASAEWLQLTDRVDLGLVCGPPKLYQFAAEVATIPLLRATGHAASLYVDQSAPFDMALEVIVNAKFQKHAAANSVTTLIIHQSFPRYAELLSALAQQGAILLGDHFARDRAPDAVAELVSEEEYKDLSQGLRDLVSTICVKSVDSLEQALLFLDLFGAKQADGIIASDPRAIDSFCRHVDTCAVMVNTSTRLSSGVPLGCGPDLAVATSKIHCRGPVTLRTLTTTKFLVRNRTPGKGALRQ